MEIKLTDGNYCTEINKQTKEPELLLLLLKEEPAGGYQPVPEHHHRPKKGS